MGHASDASWLTAARNPGRAGFRSSIMDAVGEQAKSLPRRVNTEDRDKLDEYFTSGRDIEKRLHTAEKWMQKPKPVVALKPPTDIANGADLIGRMNLMFDLMPFILQTDSTRLLTMFIAGIGAVPLIPGVTDGPHALSHHGQDESKIAMPRIIEEAQMKSFAALLTKLKAAQKSGQSVLDNTAVLFGSNLSNANAHSTSNLPILVAGGGFKHGQHLAFDEKNNTPFANLFVQIAQRMGVETEKFATSTKAGITGFEVVWSSTIALGTPALRGRTAIETQPAFHQG